MRAFIILLVTTFFFFSVKSSELKIIRDAETENFLKEISYILIKDNNLDLDNLKFFIDNKAFINAFVIPGQKIFLTKGLLIKPGKEVVFKPQSYHIMFFEFIKMLEADQMITAELNFDKNLVIPIEFKVIIKSDNHSHH